MGNILKIQDSKEIKDAIRRNKRTGLERPKRTMDGSFEYSSFLEKFVFDKMNQSPSQFVANVQNNFYAEQNFRDRRQRNVEFVRGRHHNELVWDSEIRRYVTQWHYNKRRNIPPLTYNVVSKLVRSLEGQFRAINTGNIVVCDSKDDEGSDYANMLTRCLDRIKDNNRSKTKDATNFKEMEISGQPVFKVLWENNDISKKTDIRFRNVNRAMFGINPGIIDYDMDNLHLIYEIHDTSLNDIMGSFSNGDYEKGMAIRTMYLQHNGHDVAQSAYTSQSFDGSQIRDNTFNQQGQNNAAYRYIETWVEVSDYEAITVDPLDPTGSRVCHKWMDANVIKKETAEENKRREELSEGADPDSWEIDFFTEFTPRWYVIYITPWGKVLDVRESPFKNAKHPYVMTPPDINGEVWGIVEEILDAQLSMDRQIRQADKIIDNASKGVWMVPDTAVPDTHSPKEYLAELRKSDGAVIYKVRNDVDEKHIPQQIYANSANVSGNVQEMIHLYSGLVDEITGNYGAAQGRGGGTSKTASGYALETQNASNNVAGLMETFLTCLLDRDDKIVQLILEGYTTSDYKRILGEDIDPMKLKQFGYKTKQSKGTNSTAYKMQMEQELLHFVDQQIVPFDVFAEVSSNPVLIQAKQKLEEFNKKQAQVPGGEQQEASGNVQMPNIPGLKLQ